MKSIPLAILTTLALSTSTLTPSMTASFASIPQPPSTVLLIADSHSSQTPELPTLPASPHYPIEVNTSIDQIGQRSDLRPSTMESSKSEMIERLSICQGYIPEGSQPESFEYREGIDRCQYGT